MWYVYWSTTEATAGGGTGTTVTLGSTVYNAHNFVGLVRFSGTNTIVDGSGGTISLGSGGTTTIDGDAITTGTVDADRIDTDLLRITGTNFTGEHQGGEVGGWTIDSSSIYSGSKDLSGFTSNGAITLSSTGEIHTPTFYVESDGTSGFKGTVTISGTDLTSGNTLNENTVGSDLGTGYGDSSIGGLTLASNKIYIGTGTFGHTNTPFYVDADGDFSLKDKLTWDQSAGTLSIDGNLTLTGNTIIGTLPEAHGGTGLTSISTLTNTGISISASGVLSGAGGGTVTAVGIGAHPTSTTIPTALSDLSGTLAASAGGTGLTTISTLLNSNVTASSIGLSAVANLSSAGQLQAAFTSDTSMSAGQIKVSSSAMVFGDNQSISSNSILIEASSANGARIIIAD